MGKADRCDVGAPPALGFGWIVLLLMMSLISGCGSDTNDSRKQVLPQAGNEPSPTQTPKEPELERLGESQTKALTARALEWMNRESGTHEPQLCRIIFQIDQPASASDHLEPLYVFVDKNDSKLAVRLWFKTNGDVAEAGPSQLSKAKSLAGTQPASDLISPKQVLSIAAKRYPDSKFTRIECLSTDNKAAWVFVTTNAIEYRLSAFSGQWHD